MPRSDDLSTCWQKAGERERETRMHSCMHACSALSCVVHATMLCKVEPDRKLSLSLSAGRRQSRHMWWTGGGGGGGVEDELARLPAHAPCSHLILFRFTATQTEETPPKYMYTCRTAGGAKTGEGALSDVRTTVRVVPLPFYVHGWIDRTLSSFVSFSAKGFQIQARAHTYQLRRE